MTMLSKITEREVRKHLVARKRGGNLELRWMFDGYAVRRSMGTPDMSEAVRKALKIMQAIEARRPAKMRLSSLRDEFIEMSDISHGYELVVRAAFKSFIAVVGDLKLGEIRKKHIEIYKSAMVHKVYRTIEATHKDFYYSGYAINGYLRALRAAWNLAARMEWAPEANPFSKFVKVRELRRAPHAYSPKEMAAVFQSARTKFGPDVALMLEFYLWTGLRREEGVNVQWSMVNFEEGILNVPPEVAKTSTERDVPLSARALEVLQLLREHQPRPVPHHPRTVSGWFSAIRDQLKIGGKFHDVRKTLNTWLKSVGLADSFAEAVLGHQPKGVNARHYTAYELGTIRAAMEAAYKMYHDAQKDGQVFGQKVHRSASR